MRRCNAISLVAGAPDTGAVRGQLSIRHPDGSTQQLDISEKNYRDLRLAGMGKTLKRRGRKPGSTAGAAGGPRKRRPRQNSKPPSTA
jgi:hypothetical protein